MMNPLFRSQRLAMGTVFEFQAVGRDTEHLEAVAEVGFEEVQRLDSLFSRHDPTAEIFRVNRHASDKGVMVDRELFSIFLKSMKWYEETEGAFSLALKPSSEGGWISGMEDILLEETKRRVILNDEFVRFDFGGMAKGYALESVKGLFASYGLENYLLHGGGSSGWGEGNTPRGEPWQVRITGLEGSGSPSALLTFPISQLGFSYSRSGLGNTYDPRNGRKVEADRACCVFASDTCAAEVWSTAILILGKESGVKALERAESRQVIESVAWMEPGLALEWIYPGRVV